MAVLLCFELVQHYAELILYSVLTDQLHDQILLDMHEKDFQFYNISSLTTLSHLNQHLQASISQLFTMKAFCVFPLGIRCLSILSSFIF